MTELSLSWVTSGFADSSLEGEFRRWRLPVTRRFGYICSVLALVNFVGWWPSDISLPENERYIVFGLRLLTALTGIGTFAFLTERHGYRTCERALTIGAAIFFGVANLIYVVHTFPFFLIVVRTVAMIGVFSIVWQGWMLGGRVVLLSTALWSAIQVVMTNAADATIEVRIGVALSFLAVFFAGTAASHGFQRAARLEFLRSRRDRMMMAETSHELRGPVTALLARLEAVRDGLCPADPPTIDLLHREVADLARLIEDLFTLARLDWGPLEGTLRPTDPVAVLGEVLHSYTDRFAARGIQIEGPGLPLGLPVRVMAQAGRLKQVFINLLENTLRYTDPGGLLRITVGAHGGEVAMSFDDTPPGVAVEAIPHLFDRFYRDEGARDRYPSGAGIGLAVCRDLILAHQGRITASPSPLGGLRIDLVLPCAMGDSG